MPTSNERKMLSSNEALKELRLAARRSAYQAGWVWGNTVTQIPNPPLDMYGWKLYGNKLHIQWTTDPSKLNLNIVTGICRCRTLKCQSCKCAKNNVKCLSFCTCT